MTIAILIVCALALIGLAVRRAVPPLAWLYVPASVVAGLIGFALVQIAARNDVPGFDEIRPALDLLRNWPTTLIAIVFAGLLIERPGKSFQHAIRAAARQGLMVWIIVFGQVVIGVLATALIVRQFQDVPLAFGQVIEAGFAGGHGTATSMGVVFREQFKFPAGLDIALFVATFGLIWGSLSGIALVNLGVRLGWTRRRGTLSLPSDPKTAPAPIGHARVRGDVLDPLLLQIALLAGAFAIGLGLQQILLYLIAIPSADSQLAAVLVHFKDLPLFMFTLLGGLILRELLHAVGLQRLIDPESIKRLTGVAMDVLIIAALTTLRVDALAGYVWPIVLMLSLGVIWCAVCLLVLAPRYLPREHWFELGLINYGMSTATTAQGMMLLRIVDPDLETSAAEDYALAAPLSAPFIGGGVLTFVVFPLMFVQLPVWLSLTLLVAALIALIALAEVTRPKVAASR